MYRQKRSLLRLYCLIHHDSSLNVPFHLWVANSSFPHWLSLSGKSSEKKPTHHLSPLQWKWISWSLLWFSSITKVNALFSGSCYNCLHFNENDASSLSVILPTDRKTSRTQSMTSSVGLMRRPLDLLPDNNPSNCWIITHLNVGSDEQTDRWEDYCCSGYSCR